MEIRSSTKRLSNNKTNNKRNKITHNFIQNENKNKKCSFRILNIIINSFISIFLIFLTYSVFNNYDDKWVIPFYLTLWSFFMNLFYIINVTILDYIYIFKNGFFKNKCIRYNDFIRNDYLRICFPFSISIVFLYWMLILLGDDFQYASRSLWDNCICFTFHGLIFIFLLYDTFSYPHVNKKNRKLFDFLLITGMIIIYYLVLGIAKYVLDYNPYDFMLVSNIRQIVAAGIIIYMGIMDGYIVFVLIANRFFIQEDDKENKQNEIQIDKKVSLKEKISSIEIKEENGQTKGNNNYNNNNNNNNEVIPLNLLKCPKNSNKFKLKPLNLNNKNIKEQNNINK